MREKSASQEGETIYSSSPEAKVNFLSFLSFRLKCLLSSIFSQDYAAGLFGFLIVECMCHTPCAEYTMFLIGYTIDIQSYKNHMPIIYLRRFTTNKVSPAGYTSNSSVLLTSKIQVKSTIVNICYSSPLGKRSYHGLLYDYWSNFILSAQDCEYLLALTRRICFYHVIFLVLGILLITLASFLSKSLGFYYGSAMAVGSLIFLVILLFQVGVGSFFLRYVSQLLRSILNEIGIGEDMYNPIFANSAVFPRNSWSLVGKGSLGAMVKLSPCDQITEFSGSFIGFGGTDMWSSDFASLEEIIPSQICFALLQAKDFCFCSNFIFSHCRFHAKQEFITNRHALSLEMSGFLHITDKGSYGSRTSERNRNDTIPSSLLSETDTFDFTFHNTSERKKLSKDEWNKLARDTTKKAMEELVSSPDLSKWVVAHADRITLYESKFR
ncbi:uncharacterized protein [Nicotiana sylvestris]|uniref:uncharacterized protein n=1 Tax=Nicotiana sylvestris TaxID=4096 RepID=UPI00388C6145